MDDLDLAFGEAWNKAIALCRGDWKEAARRRERTRGAAAYAGAPRAWCMALRASDTRMDRWALHDDPAAVDEYREHELELGAQAIRELVAPVRLDWPGVPLTEAAKLLGRHREGLRTWLPSRPGRTKAARAEQAPRRWEEQVDQGFPLRVRYENARSHGHIGVDVPIVWAPRALNPNAMKGESPHALWGSHWQRLSSHLPEEFALRARRSPRMRPYGSGERFRGWEWICPGRRDPSAPTGWRPCGRRSLMLFGPVPIYGVGHLWPNEDLRVDPYGATWRPGVEDPLAGQRGFACERCWRVRRLSLTNARGWNEFVTYVSAGLLHGHEVQRPEWVKLGPKTTKTPASSSPAP